MKIHTLEFLPVGAVYVLDILVGGIRKLDTPEPDAVSLYGHWCHVRYADDTVESFPAAHIVSILWS
jgi:hypothetical protein